MATEHSQALSKKDRNIRTLLSHLLEIHLQYQVQYQRDSLFIRTRSAVFPYESPLSKARFSLTSPLPQNSARSSLDTTEDSRTRDARAELAARVNQLFYGLARQYFNSEFVKVASDAPLLHRAVLQQALLDVGVSDRQFMQVVLPKSKTWISPQTLNSSVSTMFASVHKLMKKKSQLMQLFCFMYVLLQEHDELDLFELTDLLSAFGGDLPPLVEVQLAIKTTLSFQEFYRLVLKICF